MHHRDIAFPVTLSTPELAFLLDMLKAQSLLGTDQAALFPPSKDEHERLLQDGYAQLLASGWLIPDPADGSASINDQLLLLTSPLADPEVVVLTERTIGQHQDGVAHYLARDMVVEMVQREQFELTALADMLTLGLRVGHTLGFTASPVPAMTCVLKRSEFGAIKAHPDLDTLIQHGVEPQVAQMLYETLRDLAHTASIKVVKTFLSQAVTVRPIGVLVGNNGATWWTVPIDRERIELHLSNDQTFATMLITTIEQLRDVSLEAQQAR